jgi:small-conductance mechanosensitive channel
MGAAPSGPGLGLQTAIAMLIDRNSLATWTTAVGVAIAVLFALGLLRRVAVVRLAALATRTRTDADDVLVGVVRRTHTYFLAAVALYAGAGVLELPPRVQLLVSAAVTLAVVLQLGLWGNALAALLVERHARRQAAVTEGGGTASVQALGYLARFALWTVLVLLALDNLGINITALVAGLGVGGVAVALAVQNILGDLFASLSIVLDRPFVLDDFIIVDDLMGTVEHIGLKTTRIRSLSGEQIVFSNADLLKSRIRNYKRMFERRVVLQLGTVYETPAEAVARIPGMLRGIIESQGHVRFDRAHFKGFGASSLDFEAVFYVLDPDYNTYMDIQQAINLEILRRFAAEGIDFAFPSRTVYVRAATPTGDRPAQLPNAPALRDSRAHR